jgi:phosphatidylinositol alpha-mannosyltransferase
VRIALVAEDYYPQLGGVPEHVHHLALALRARGHLAEIVTSHMRGAGADPPFVRRVGTSLVIYANGGVARVTAGWQLRRQLTRLFRQRCYDLVHVHGGLNPTFGLLAPVAALEAGIPVVATFHTWFPRSAGYRMLRKPLQRLLDRHAGVIAVSTAARDAMARYFRANWHIIPNGVDTASFHPDGRQLSEVLEAPCLLFLGRLEPRNGLGTLLEALPAVLARYPRARFLVAGDGPWRRRYRHLAACFGDRVAFLGAVWAERPALYRAADLYLCPTNRASFGVTLLEAMASGTPMVVSDLPAFREVAAGAARYVPADDAAAWGEAIVTLLGDAAARRALAAAGRARALAFDWSVVAERVLACYREALAQVQQCA